MNLRRRSHFLLNNTTSAQGFDRAFRCFASGNLDSRVEVFCRIKHRGLPLLLNLKAEKRFAEAFALNQDESKIWDDPALPGVSAMGQYNPRFDLLKSSRFDPRALWNRVNGDAELLRELVEIFMAESPMLLQSIASGIERRAFQDVKKFSHKLKGSALQFSGAGVASLAASLERMGEEQSLHNADQVFANLQKEVATLIESLQSITSGKARDAR